MRSLVLAGALAFAASAPAARAAELPPGLDEAQKEGEKWFDAAGNTDLPEGQRNEARKKALVNLKKVLDALNRHWDEHPEDQTRIEDRMCKVGQKMYWIKKESPLSVLEEAGLAPKRAAPIQPPPPPPSGGGGTPPAPPGSGGSGNPFDGPAPKTTGGEAAAAPAKKTLEQSFAEAEAYAKAHKADTAGIMERYQGVMAAHPEATGHALFQKAVERAGQANAALKDVYRALRNEDPDSLRGAESDDVGRMVLVLKRDLGSQDAAVRERAARYLGLLGSREGIYPLVAAMKGEAEEQALRALGDAVVAIGGVKAAEHLGKLRDDKRLAGRALDLLTRMTSKNAVDRRLAIREVGGFAMAKDDAVASKAVDFLVGIGAEGAHGLVQALDTNRVEVRLKVIEALGATGNPKVAGPLANFLIFGADNNINTKRCKDAAYAAILSIGEPAVPYLFRGLRSATTKQWTGELLRKITGQMFSSSRPGDWVNWWKSSHPDWKEEKD